MTEKFHFPQPNLPYWNGGSRQAPILRRELVPLVSAILEGRWNARERVCDTRFIDLMWMVFGPPMNCLWCEAPLLNRKMIIMDVDQWFCRAHCPVCNDVWPPAEDPHEQ